MKRVQWLFGFVFTMLTLNAFADNPSFDEKMAKVFARIPEASIGVVMSNPQGDIIYSHNANKQFTPASTTKVFTAAAALAKLGPDYKYATILAESGHSVYLIMHGDPSFGSENLKKLLETLKEKGITTIKGNFVIDDTAFNGPRHGKGVEWQDSLWYYGAPADTIILDNNQMRINIKANEPNKKASLTYPEWEKYRPSIVGEVKSVNHAQANAECQLIIHPDHQNNMHVHGCWAEKNPVTLRLAIQNTRPYIKDRVEDILKQLGIKLKGHVTFGKAPQDAIVLKTHDSADLSKLVSRVLKKSDNLYADSLLKNLAVESGHSGNFKTGVATLKKVLSNAGYKNANQLELYDGSGLSHYNLVSPQQLEKVLVLALKNKDTWGKAFIKGLPTSGVDGTLRYRFSDTPLKGKVTAKTGGLTGVQTLAGYLVHNNQYYPFAIMIDNVPKSKRKQTNLLQAGILLNLLDDVKAGANKSP